MMTPHLLIPTIEGRRSSAQHPIPDTQRHEALDRLRAAGIPIPKESAHLMSDSTLAEIKQELVDRRVLTTAKLSNASRRVVGELLQFASQADAEVARLRGIVEAAGANVAAISSMISGSYPSDLDPEAHMWRRHQKVANEAGEVLDAIEGAIGENPRKGIVKTWADVDKELLDTANAALGAYEHNHGNDGSSIAALFAHIEFVRGRLAAALVPSPTDSEETK